MLVKNLPTCSSLLDLKSNSFQNSCFSELSKHTAAAAGLMRPESHARIKADNVSLRATPASSSGKTRRRRRRLAVYSATRAASIVSVKLAAAAITHTSENSNSCASAGLRRWLVCTAAVSVRPKEGDPWTWDPGLHLQDGHQARTFMNSTEGGRLSSASFLSRGNHRSTIVP